MENELFKTVLVGAVLLLAVVLLVRPKGTRDLGNEYEILAEIDVMESYGSQKQAKKLLKEALAAHPKKWVYKERLERLG